jgi:hypothetical protein
LQIRNFTAQPDKAPSIAAKNNAAQWAELHGNRPALYVKHLILRVLRGIYQATGIEVSHYPHQPAAVIRPWRGASTELPRRQQTICRRTSTPPRRTLLKMR